MKGERHPRPREQGVLLGPEPAGSGRASQSHAQRAPSGDRKNKTRKRRTSAPARKKKYVRASFFFFLCVFGRFSARGVRKHEKKGDYVSKKNTGESFFLVIFFLLLFLSIFLLRWLSASR
jgi:hypothetical protein